MQRGEVFFTMGYEYTNTVSWLLCRPRSDDRVGVGVQPSTQTVTEVVEGSSDEEADDEEPIYDEPEGEDDFNE